MFARTHKSPAPLLRLWDIVDDTILTTEGCFMRALELSGIDSEHLASDVLMRAAQQLYEGAKNDLKDETLLQFLVIGHEDYGDFWTRFESVPRSEDQLLNLQRDR